MDVPDGEAVHFVATILVLSVFAIAYIRSFFRRRIDRPSPLPQGIRWSLVEAGLLLLLYFGLMGVGGVIVLVTQQSLIGPLRMWMGSALRETWWGPLILEFEMSSVFAPIALPFVAYVTLVLVYVVAVRVSRSPPAALGLRSPPNLVEALRLSILAVALWFPVSLVGIAWKLLLDGLDVSTSLQLPVLEFSSALDRGDAVLLSILVFAAVLHAPVMEEILFRSLFYGACRRRWGSVCSAIVTSIVFAVVHANLVAVLPILFLSLVLCAVYERRGSIWDSMIVHAVFNGGSLAALALSGVPT